MSVPRVRLESSARLPDGSWQLDAAGMRHLTKSLRLYEGAMINGLSSDDGTIRSLRLERRDGELRLVELSVRDGIKNTGVVLAIGLLKSDQFEPTLRVCAEFGVSEVIPLVCERSVPRISNSDLARKMERWNKIMLEATKVSGAVRPPFLRAPMPFDAAPWSALPASRYAALLNDDTMPIANAPLPNGEAVVAIGPEGDWTEREATKLLEEGFVPVSLGRMILRASTAAAAAVSFLTFALDASRSQDA